MDKQINDALRGKLGQTDNLLLLSTLADIENELEGLQKTSSLLKKEIHFNKIYPLFGNVITYLIYFDTISKATAPFVADEVYHYENYLLAGVNNFVYKMNLEIDKMALLYQKEIESEQDELKLYDLKLSRGGFQDTLLKWVDLLEKPFENHYFKTEMENKGYTLDRIYTHEKPNLTTSLYEFQYDNVLGELKKLPDVQLKELQNELKQWLDLDAVSEELHALLRNWKFFEGYTLDTAVERSTVLMDSYNQLLTSLANSKGHMNSCVDLGYSFKENKNLVFERLGHTVKVNVLLEMKNDIGDLHRRIYPDFESLSQYVQTMFPVHFFNLDTAELDYDDIEDDFEVRLPNYAKYIFQSLFDSHKIFKKASKDNPMRDLLGVYLLKYALEDISLFSSNSKVYNLLDRTVSDLPSGVVLGYLFVLYVAYDIIQVRNGKEVY